MRIFKYAERKNYEKKNFVNSNACDNAFLCSCDKHKCDRV